jgi:peptidoglycan biosynthesis protein MviN/MurJ (putative lipid II flippase)
VQFLTLYILWGKKYGGFGAVREEAVKLGKIVAASAVGAAVCYGVNGILSGFGTIGDFGRGKTLTVCAAASMAALLVVFGMYELFGMQKFRASLGGLFRRR